MKLTKWLSLSIAAVGVLAIVLTSSTAGAAPAGGDCGAPCDKSARSTFKAARHEAHADFWLAVAVFHNDPECDFWECVQEAYAELLEELSLALDQYVARLEICEELGHGPYAPDIDPDDFSPDVTNNYFPLVPGRTLVYEKMTSEGLERVEFTVLADIVEIEDFECRVVNDVETIDGELAEDTVDWFAQDDDGNVWYMGEISRNYEDGFLDNLDGSWRHERDDALAGIIMLASPAVDDFYRQEFYINEAEDVARVVSLNETVVVPAGTFTNCLQTMEWTPLEPGDSLEYKYYAPGIGMVLEVDPATGERLELVQIIN
jgi:hypothetical protein